jgi:hypothetical protein
MATPESLAIRHAEAAERLADAMQAIRESVERTEAKVDAVLADASKAPPKSK